MTVRYLVIFKQETEPVETFGFDNETEAREHYERLRLNWTEVWLTEVIEGPGMAGQGLYRRCNLPGQGDV